MPTDPDPGEPDSGPTDGEGGSPARDRFEAVGERDSKSRFTPGVVALVVSNAPDRGPNVMTAAWWMVAGYRPFRYLLAVTHHAYTHELIEANPEFVLAAPSTDMIDALTLCGAVSGRDLEEIDHLGLETVPGAPSTCRCWPGRSATSSAR